MNTYKLLFALCAAAFAASAWAQTDLLKLIKLSEYILRMDGIGALEIGMSLSDVRNGIANQQVSLDKNPRKDCAVTTIENMEILLMHGRIVRFTVNEDTHYHTLENIRVGDSMEKLAQAYKNRATMEADSKDANKHYVKLHDAENHAGYMFETNAREVTAIHAGLEPDVNSNFTCLDVKVEKDTKDAKDTKPDTKDVKKE